MAKYIVKLRDTATGFHAEFYVPSSASRDCIDNSINWVQGFSTRSMTITRESWFGLVRKDIFSATWGFDQADTGEKGQSISSDGEASGRETQ